MKNKIFVAALMMMFSYAMMAQDSASVNLNRQQDSVNVSNDNTQPTDSAAGSSGSSTGVSTSENTFDPNAPLSDEDLKKYAVTMDSVNDMKESLIEEIGKMVKENGKMTNTRYNQLSKISTDEAKLKEAKATPEEIEVLKKINDRKTQGAEEIKETFQNMAKDYVGAELYNKIKASIESDTEVKARYDAILAEVDKDDDKDNKENK